MQDLIHAQRLKSMGFNGPRHFIAERNNTDGTGQYYVSRTISLRVPTLLLFS